MHPLGKSAHGHRRECSTRASAAPHSLATGPDDGAPAGPPAVPDGWAPISLKVHRNPSTQALEASVCMCLIPWDRYWRAPQTYGGKFKGLTNAFCSTRGSNSRVECNVPLQRVVSRAQGRPPLPPLPPPPPPPPPPRNHSHTSCASEHATAVAATQATPATRC